jgi:uncharacterized protein YutE (UPF0331/DUF86 family)
MTPQHVSKRIVLARIAIVDKMLERIGRLPLEGLEAFLADDRNVSAAESNLRRALEALLDVGRHILAKGYASGVTEYKEIVTELLHHQVITKAEATQMYKMAGYRNRMVHLYHEVTEQEIYVICTKHLGDIVTIRNAYQRWLEAHLDQVDDLL